MLRAIRCSPLAPTVRRLLAVLLLVCVSVAFAEPMIADSCDEDAQRSDVAGEVSGMASAAMSALGREPAPQPGPSAPEHSLHLCHCTHVHGSTLTARHSVVERLQIVNTVRVTRSDRLPPSVIGEPQLRPPRLLRAA